MLQERKEKVRYSDLDAVKQENLTVHSFISDKMSMLQKRMTEFEVRAHRLENHCFKQQEPILIQVNQRFNDLKTEIYYRIENFSNSLEELKAKVDGYKVNIDLFNVSMGD